MIKTRYSISLLIITFLFANAKAVESSAKLKDCPQGFANIVTCGTAEDQIRTRGNLDFVNVPIVKKGVLQCIPRECSNVEKIIQLNNQKNSAQNKQEQTDQLPEQSQQSQSLDSSSPVTSTAAHETNPTTEFLLASFDEIWVSAKGLSLGKMDDVMSRLNKMGYEKRGSSIAAVHNKAVLSLYATCGKKSCDSAGAVVTRIKLGMKPRRGKEFLFPNLVEMTLAHLRMHLGNETGCSKREEQRLQCNWMPSSARPYHGRVNLTVWSKYPSPGASFSIGLQKI